MIRFIDVDQSKFSLFAFKCALELVTQNYIFLYYILITKKADTPVKTEVISLIAVSFRGRTSFPCI